MPYNATLTIPISDEEAKLIHDVLEHPGYGVDATGRVWSRIKAGGRGGLTGEWRLLTPRKNKRANGEYRIVDFRGAGKHQAIQVHRVVASVFLPPPRPDQVEVRHLDNNPAHNSAGNLAWGTKQENEDDKEIHGTRRRGERVWWKAKLTAEEVLSIRVRLSAGVSCPVIAKEKNVSREAIYAIRDYKNWKHI